MIDDTFMSAVFYGKNNAVAHNIYQEDMGVIAQRAKNNILDRFIKIDVYARDSPDKSL